MTTARSFGNYDLAGALADLIDNSIKAHSRSIEITCSFLDNRDCEVRVRDDGAGMTKDELIAAMRPASSNPAEERSPDDLGRFGWGMKSASFSQCKILTVISSTGESVFGARWNLDDIDDWNMDILDSKSSNAILLDGFGADSGTELVWSNCDRLSENGSLTRDQFNALIVEARRKLSLIFHRYLSGDGGRIKPLNISINGTRLDIIDPFCTSNLATRAFTTENIKVPVAEGTENIEMQAYTLPHYSKLTPAEYEEFAGEEGYVKNQGFYVYRNRRLIIWGTWFKLAKHGELSKLVRVRVDIPNTLDEMWKITVDKSDAQLPAILKQRMKSLVDGFRSTSSRVFRSKGARVDQEKMSSVWERRVRKQVVRYSINENHPLIRATLNAMDKGGKGKLKALLGLIESEIPLESINYTMGDSPHAVQQRATSPEEFEKQFLVDLPLLMVEAKDPRTLQKMLKVTEPYASNWHTVETLLKKQGIL
jgi:hypothetical protein